MPCFTRVKLEALTDDEIHRQARKHLGLSATGVLLEQHAAAVRIEVGVIRTYKTLRTLAPTALIRRSGNKLTVSVQR